MSRRRGLFYLVLLSLFSTGLARADDAVIITHPHTGAFYENPVVVPPVIDHRSILLDLNQIQAPAPNVDAFSTEPNAPGSITTTYRGVQSLAARRILGYYRRLFGEDLKRRDDIDARVEKMSWAQADLAAGGQWWTRSWRESLGVFQRPARQEIIGQEIELFRFGELSLTNEGKVSCGRLSVYLDDDRIYEKFGTTVKKLALGSPAKADKTPRVIIFSESHADVGFTWDDVAADLDFVHPGHATRYRTPKGSLFTGDGWNASLRPNIQLRAPTGLGDPASAVSNLSLEIGVNIYPAERRELWGCLEIRLEASPRDRTASASAMFAILRW